MSLCTIANIIRKSNLNIVVFTGGEPLLQIDKIIKIIRKVPNKQYHLETNGDLIGDLILTLSNQLFSYICFSPTNKNAIDKIRYWTRKNYVGKDEYDIKIVTNLVLNKDLIPYATMLMPLTKIFKWPKLGENFVNFDIRQKVWDYCVKHNIKYSPRLHVEVWGVGKRKV